MKIKAFGEDEKIIGLFKRGKFFSFEFARVGFAKNPNNIFPLKLEIILAKESQVRFVNAIFSNLFLLL